MANNYVTLVGRLTADPELRFTPSGDAVAEFTVASNERRYDRETNTWVDEKNPVYMTVSAWRKLAEGAAETLGQGSLVIVQGRLKSDTWEKDGQTRSKIKMVADEIGASVRFATTSKPPVQTVPISEIEPAW